MGNPIIRKYEQADEEHKAIATDYFGNDVYPNDKVLDFNGDLMNLEEVTISLELINYLKKECGAKVYRIEK